MGSVKSLSVDKNRAFSLLHINRVQQVGLIKNSKGHSTDKFVVFSYIYNFIKSTTK